MHSATGSYAVIGSPTSMMIGTLGRRSFLGSPLVHTRWEPQMVTVMIGTPAASAIRTAPDLKPLISKLRLMVASGNTPTSSPALRRSTASSNDALPAVRSTGMCLSSRMIGPATGCSNTSCLAMYRMNRLCTRAGRPA